MKLFNNYTITNKVYDSLPYFEIENFTIEIEKNEHKPKTFIEGFSFLIPAKFQTFYHITLGLIPQVFILKNAIKKDINIYIYFEDSPEVFLNFGNLSYRNSVLSKLCVPLRKLGINVNFLFLDDYKKISFEKIVFMDHQLIFILRDFFKDRDFLSVDTEFRVQKYAKELRDQFKKIIPNDRPLNKKIFISRKHHSNLLRKGVDDAYMLYGKGYIKILENEIIYGENFNPHVEFQKNGTETSFIKHLVDAGMVDVLPRNISEKDEEKIENFFMDNGYEIVDFNNMAFEQQIDILCQTSHVATLMGSNLINTLFIPDNPKVFIINNNPPFHYTHRYYIDHIFKDVRYIFPENNGNYISDYSADEIITFIEQNYMHEI